jgi:prepilin-type N-terminal cleavage/methylation domain-containing protein
MTLRKDRFRLSYPHKAFTLVELLVVVAVLALLASIVFSNLTGAREQAKISNALSFQSNMHNLLGADLVGWWNFDGNVNDYSGIGNNGTVFGATYVDDAPTGKGKSLKFNGSSNYVEIPHHSTQLLVNGGTISAWIKPVGGTTGRVVDKSDGGSAENGFGYSINVDGSRMRFRVVSRIVYSAVDSITIDGKKWQYVTVTWDGSGKVTHYVNDTQSGTPASIDNLSSITTEHTLRIGRSGSSDYFNGLIDDVRIYSRALTAYEVQTLYAQTKDNYLARE